MLIHWFSNTTNSNNIVPPYCFRAFCYVDAKTCKRYSEERVYRSGYFGYDENIDVYYSYSTCNSTADDWLEVEDDIVGSRALGGIDIEAWVIFCTYLVSLFLFMCLTCYIAILYRAVPTYLNPYMYKMDGEGEILLDRGDEYYDDSIPYDGVFIHFAKQIMEGPNQYTNGTSISLTTPPMTVERSKSYYWPHVKRNEWWWLVRCQNSYPLGKLKLLKFSRGESNTASGID